MDETLTGGSWNNSDNNIDSDSFDAGAVEFDGPAVTCPGGFERGYPWRGRVVQV